MLKVWAAVSAKIQQCSINQRSRTSNQPNHAYDQSTYTAKQHTSKISQLIQRQRAHVQQTC